MARREAGAEIVVPEEADEFAGFDGAAIEVVVANTPADGHCFGTPGQCFSTYEIEGTTIGIGYRRGTLRVWQLEASNRPLTALATVSSSGGLGDNDIVESLQPL